MSHPPDTATDDPPHRCMWRAGCTLQQIRAEVPGPRGAAAEIRDELGERMDRDLNSPVGGYGVWSLYYDSPPELRFYWEKIEGLKFRRKLRIRHYGDPVGVTDDSPPVCVEIKQRVNRVTQKRRITLRTGRPVNSATGANWWSTPPRRSARSSTRCSTWSYG